MTAFNNDEDNIYDGVPSNPAIAFRRFSSQVSTDTEDDVELENTTDEYDDKQTVAPLICRRGGCSKVKTLGNAVGATERYEYHKMLVLLVATVLFFIKLDSDGMFDDGLSVEEGGFLLSTRDLGGSDSFRHMRWQPAPDNGQDADCLFRLANTEALTCAPAYSAHDLSYLSQEYEGTKYCAGVVIQPNQCMLPVYGAWKAPSESTDLSEIPPLPRRYGVDRYFQNPDLQNELPRCNSMSDYLAHGHVGAQGQFYPPIWARGTNNSETLMPRLEGFDRQYVTETCSSIPLSPFIWTENAACQTTITLLGDSHVRQLFIATVAGLRGVEAFVEGHGDAEEKDSGIIYSYEWRLYNDGTADDRLLLHYGTDLNGSKIRVAHCTCSDQVQRCLRIFFVWAPKFNDQLSHIDKVKEFETNLLIVEPGNAYELMTTLPEDWTNTFEDLLEEDKKLHFGIIHWPPRHPLQDRTEASRSWVNNSPHGDRMTYLRQDEIKLYNDNLQLKNTNHFACSLGMVNVKNDMINAQEPCTDQADISSIRALTTVLFEAFLNEELVRWFRMNDYYVV